MLVIIGYVVVLATVFGGFVLSGGNLMSLFQPTELLIIGGAGVGAFIVGNNGKAIRATLKALPSLFKGSHFSKSLYLDLLGMLYLLLAKSRQSGLVALENDIEDPQNSPIFSAYPRLLADADIMNFIVDYLRLMVSGNMNAFEIEALTQVNFTAVLDEQKPTQDLPAGVKPQPSRPEAQPAMPVTESAVEGKAQSLTPADSSAQATSPAAAPLSESLTQALHNLKGAEPVATPHIVAQAAPVTATAPATAIATSTVATATLQAEVGTPAWQQSLGQQIAVFSRNGVHHAELRLHPEELGALQVSLRVNNDQAQVHFVSESHHVRAALESAMPNLRTMLEESGISLGQSSVGADTSSSAGDAHSGHTSGQGKSESGEGDLTISSEEESPVVTRVMHYSRGINTFA